MAKVNGGEEGVGRWRMGTVVSVFACSLEYDATPPPPSATVAVVVAAIVSVAFLVVYNFMIYIYIYIFPLAS